ncbi:MAG: proprotein convertase P-domain-containing protein, partial [Winogradskyella sp.]|nr:proprotein convertase P-domain-containing protein [Winogradskyella sp.]
MKKFYTKPLLLCAVFLFSMLSYSQNNKGIWTPSNAQKKITLSAAERNAEPKKESFFELNMLKLKQQLLYVGNRNSTNAAILEFPLEDGRLYAFSVLEASVMHPDLQAKYPEIRSYIGQGIDNPSEIIRFSITPKGFHGMILNTKQGTQFINPYTEGGDTYTVFAKQGIKASNNQFECDVIGESNFSNRSDLESFQRNANDGLLRDFRLALACTGEYAQFHGGTVGSVMTEFGIAMTRVNGIYERDLSITMTMVANNDQLIFLNGATDPYTNNSGSTMLTENQTTVDGTIGNLNYDIGHVFSTGGGGVAFLGSSCVNSIKAGGVTGLGSPTGDPFYVDFVSHEMGHQFGAPHTFNSDNGSCGGGNRTASNAYEPGSGTTIMAYAGICAPENVQNNSDDYFHQKSLEQIWNHVTTSGPCPASSATSNSAPIALAGTDYTIPADTPFKLTGSSTDIDGTSSHTFTWEQYDLTTNTNPPSATSPDGPLVRSYKGTTDPTRYIPRLQDVLANPNSPSTTWEVLTLLTRSQNYRLTIRDNDVRGGQTAVDEMTVSVDNSGFRFRVTSQNTTGITWTPGNTETITWDRANTDQAPFNTSNINILLSTDGGLTFDTVLAANTPNDGTHDIVVPSVSSANCRIMVEAVGNIFFNVNTEPISIGVAVTCNNYDSGVVNVPIPDGNDATGSNPGAPAFSTINVPDNVLIESFSLSVDISHTYIGDLLIQIQHPDVATNNAFVNVYLGECGNNTNINVTFEDGAPAIACASPTTGTYAPSNPLSLFNGLSSQGDWTIAVVDYFSADTGTLNSWSMEICSTTPLSVDEVALDNLSVYPNPNNGEFNVSFNPRSGDDIIIEVFDISGRSILSNTYNNTGRFDETIMLNKASSAISLLSIS